MKIIINSILFIFLSFIASGNSQIIKVETKIKILKGESIEIDKVIKDKKIGYIITPKEFSFDLKNEYIDEIKIQNTGNTPLNFLVTPKEEERCSLEIYPKYLKLKSKESKVIKFSYISKNSKWDNKFPKILIKPIPDKENKDLIKELKEIDIKIKDKKI